MKQGRVAGNMGRCEGGRRFGQLPIYGPSVY